MPPLPAPQRRERYPVAQIPQPPEGAFGASVQAVAHGLQQEIDRIEELEDRQRLETFAVDTSGQIRQGIMNIREAAAGESDPDKYKAIYDKGIADIQKQVVKQAGPNDRYQQVAQRVYQQQVNSELDNVVLGVVQRRQDQAIVSAAQNRDLTLQRLAESPDPLVRHEGLTQFRLDVDNAPFLTAEQRFKLKEGLEHDVERERGYQLLEKNPQALLDSLQADSAKNYPNLQGSERETLREHAQDALARIKRQAAGQAQEQIENTNINLLQMMEAGKLTPSVVFRSGLPFKDQQHWIDKLHRSSKNVDPFAASVPAIRGQVLKEIYNERRNPDGTPYWTQQNVLDLMGRGLSVTHALQAANIIKERSKTTGELPSKYAPLRATVNTLDELRRGFALIDNPPSKRSEATEKQVLDNDKEYQRILNKLQEPLPQGKTHRDVLDEQMKPIMEQRARGWFDRNITPFFSPRTPEQIQHGEKYAPGTVTPAERAAGAPKATPAGVAVSDDEVKAFVGRAMDASTLQRARDFLASHPNDLQAVRRRLGY